MITHDISEAISFADRIIVLSKRPATIKNEYEVLMKTSGGVQRRKDEKFSYYYDLLWKDLDKDV